MKRAMLIVAALWTVTAGTAWPIDQIFTSTKEKPYFGKIVGMTSTVITFEARQNAPSDIQANEIRRIIFESSPDALLAAQKDMLDAEYEKAIDALKRETVEDKRREVGE